MTYSLDLGAVPFKVEEITKDISAQLKTLSHAAQSLDSTNADQFLGRAKKVREKLFFIDNQLNDCVEIMQGYLSTLREYSHLADVETELNLADGSPVSPHSHDNSDEDSLSQLQQNLEKIDKLLDNE